MTHKRWLATVTYRTDNGPVDVHWDIEELEELHDLVEAGPNFYAIEKIEIVIANNIEPGLTVEIAERQ